MTIFEKRNPVGSYKPGLAARVAPLGRLYNPAPPADGTVVVATLGGMFSLLGKKWRTLMAFALTGLVLGFVISSLMQRKYVAVMQVVPNVEEQFGNISGLSSSLGGLGSLVSGGGLAKPENVTPFQRFRAIMASRDVADELERRGHFLEQLFPDRWDSVENTWKPKPDDPFTLLKSGVKDILRLPNYPHPVAEDLMKIIHDKVDIGEDEKQSIYTFSFADKDPSLAKRFLTALYEATEAVLLRREKVTAIARVNATVHQIELTTVESNRQALLNVLTMFQMRAMQTAVGSPFGARVLSSPATPDQPDYPSIPIFMGAGLLTGLLLSILLVVLQGMRVARDFDDPNALPDRRYQR